MAFGLTFLAVLAAASSSAAKLGPSGPAVRMTVEIDWDVPPLPALPTPVGPRVAGSPPVSVASPVAELSLSEGRVVEVQDSTGTNYPHVRGGVAPWRLGPAPRGRSRVRLEAPLGSELTVKVAGQAFRVALGSLLEGAQRTPPRSGFEIGVERLAWDAIEVASGEPTTDGTAEPGSMVPLTVTFNVLTPEPADVNLRCLAELRPIQGGEPVWRAEWQEVVATNTLEPPRHPLVVPARGPEGTYVLEVKSSWEPLADPAGTRLGRWVRRRRNPSQTTSATRRTTLAVLGPQPSAAPPPSKVEGPPVGVEVDAIDLARARGHRPSASGRGPLDAPGRAAWTVPEMALVDPSLRDRLRGWINRTLVDPPALGPADPSGLAWSAVGLRVPHPERPHRLTLSVSGGHPTMLGVAMVAGGGAGGRGRVVLDACVSGPPILDGGAPLVYSWPVWPDSEAPVLVLVNRSASATVQVGSITLTELPEMLSAAVAVAGTQPDRSLGLHLAIPRSLDRFGGGDDSGRVDPLVQARNLSLYLAHCGASTVVLPEGLADRTRRIGLQGQAEEDSTGPDRLDLMLRVLARRGATAWVDVAFEGTLPGLPQADSPEARVEGLVRLDRRGGLDGTGSYQPIHPRVREAMARKLADAVAPRKARPNLAGALVRLGPGSTLPGGPDAGLDDPTFARFVAAAFEPGSATRVPGQGSADPLRFEARARYVEGGGRLPWLAWRSKEVASIYASLALAARESAPGATLAVSTPGLEPGPAGDEARRVDLAGLGPGHAWRGVGLDLARWPTGEAAPVVFRGAGLSTDDLGHDLATSPELDDLVAARPGRGALLGVGAVDRDPALAKPSAPRLTALPMADGATGDEPLTHTLAALDPGRVIVSSTAAAGQEERLRRFARVFAVLPSPPTGSPSPRPASGIIARPARSGPDTYLTLVNDTPYPILLETLLQGPANATVTNLGRGIELDPERVNGRTRLVLELAPHGASAIRVGSPDVALAQTTPHPGPAVLDGMKAQYDDLHSALKRLDRLAPGEPSGPSLAGESERLNARRDLTAALSAYRERRYADFARLGGSHWSRNAASGTATAVAGERSGVIRTGDSRTEPSSKLNR